MGATPEGHGGRNDPEILSWGEAGLRLLLGRLPVILWSIDRSLKFTSSLGQGLVGLGLRPGQVNGLSLYDYFGRRDDGSGPIAAHLAALEGETSEIEMNWNGRTFEVRVEPLRNDQGACVGALGLALDVTDQRRADSALRAREEELVRAQKLEAVGLRARALVHDLSDVFTAILGGAERLAGVVPPAHPLREDLECVTRAAGRGAELLSQLRASERTGQAASTPQPLAAPDGRETILLVEDEPQVRSFVRRALEENGYRVLEAAAVDEALALGASYPGRIHLLLTDVVLPGMNGPQLAARLAPMRPEMRILYMTGYADAAVVDRGVVSAGQSLLVKPFTSLGLAHEVKKALRN